MKRLLVDRVFDPNEGWNFSARELPVRKDRTAGGNPLYRVTVDGVELLVYELDRWAEASASRLKPNRIVVRRAWSGIEISEHLPFLHDNFATDALPCFGIDPKDGQPVMDASFPVWDGFPVDIARRQTLGCMALIAEQSADIDRQWTENSASRRRAQNSASPAAAERRDVASPRATGDMLQTTGRVLVTVGRIWAAFHGLG